MLKIVLDTNVIISGLNFPASKPATILALVASGEIANFISAPIINETKRILSGSFLWSLAEVEEAELWLKTFSIVVDPKNRLAIIADEPDNRVLECASEAQADCIVSGDHHLTDLNAYGQIKIVTPAQFLSSCQK